MRFGISILVAAALSGGIAQAAPELSQLELLGKALFHDENLSLNRTQSCATCHDPEQGFADPRDITSLGDDGTSFGNRNAPTASYARFIPGFHRTDAGVYAGGVFLDGRAADLEDQVGGPPLNPVEMGMPDTASITARVRENPDYVDRFSTLFGSDVLQDETATYEAIKTAIAAFERTDLFSPFDSKYDRYLRGEVSLSREEDLGRVLFFSEQFTNCALCHKLQGSGMHPQETFSNYEFHNIGVPVNPALQEKIGSTAVDMGLAGRGDVDDPGQAGKFRTPTLRNVAVTGPYMHNGVFEDLRTVVLFYNQFNTRSEKRRINPETGHPFGPPAVMQTLAVKELTHGPALDDERVDALVAFLKTLTDARYEHLLDE